MAEIDLIIDLHKNLKRQGPGSEEDTLRALGFTDTGGLKNLKIADIGCGTGGQTLTLAKHTEAEIIAVDLFPDFLEVLERNAKKAGVQDQIRTVTESMDALSFEKEYMDVIWSEGAIYSMGFEAGVKNWQKFLKPGGYLCVSEITWITGSRPRRIEDFWKAEYPEIDRASNKFGILESNGFSLMGYFILPGSSWTQEYYQPLLQAFNPFLQRNNHAPGAKQLVESIREEIRLYEDYQAYYSYGFYIARKD